MFRRACILLALISIAQCNVFSRCDRNEPTPLDVQFPNCRVNDEFCQLRRNQAINIRVTFAARQRVRALNVALHQWNGRDWIEWRLGARSTVCDFLANGQRCPLPGGFRVTYELRTTVPQHVQLNTRNLLHIRIQDESGTAAACFQIATLFVL